MKQKYRLVVEGGGREIVHTLEVADSFLTRLRGLLFRRALPRGHGLLLVPCASVHTFMMRFAIDLVMLDREGKVVKVSRSVRPWRAVSAPRGTYAVLEITGGTVGEMAPGDRFLLKAEAQTKPPPSLRFLPRDQA